ncbi:hypothetical protein AAHK20_08390 [Trinickia sp. YCB016]
MTATTCCFAYNHGGRLLHSGIILLCCADVSSSAYVGEIEHGASTIAIAQRASPACIDDSRTQVMEDVRIGQQWLSLPVFIRKAASRLEFASLFTCERLGRKWVREFPAIPMPPIGASLGGDVPLPALSISGSEPNGETPTNALAEISRVLANRQFSPPTQDAILTLASLADFQQYGHWETIQLPELTFGFIWSAEYDSSGGISNPRAVRVDEQPL